MCCKTIFNMYNLYFVNDEVRAKGRVFEVRAHYPMLRYISVYRKFDLPSIMLKRKYGGVNTHHLCEGKLK